MFDRFTDSARKVMANARQEAKNLNHEYIGTEHILLGLLRVDPCAARCVLAVTNADIEKIRAEVLRLVTPGPTPFSTEHLLFTPQAKKVLEIAAEIAVERFQHNYIGTAHLLPALARGDTIAAAALQFVNLTEVELIEEVDEFLELQKTEREKKPNPTPPAPDRIPTPEEAAQSWRDALQASEELVSLARILNERIQSALKKLDLLTPTPTNTSIVMATEPPPCHGCGTPMVRSGSCYKCMNCGETSGCS